MQDRTAKLVEFAQGGDSVEFGRFCCSSGYGNPDSPHAADPATTTIPDGTIAIDKRAAIDTPEGYAWVFKGPMVDVDLPDGGVDPCPQPSALMAGAVAENAFGALLATHTVTRQTQKRGSLDHVSISEYVQGWADHGARIGHYVDGQIIWHDE